MIWHLLEKESSSQKWHHPLFREGVREAMKKTPQETNSLNEAISLATKRMSISKNEWLAHGNMLKLVAQTNMSDFF